MRSVYLAILLLMSGCHDDAKDDADAVAVVKQFFAATEAKDCKVVADVMIPFKGKAQIDEAACKDLLEDFTLKQVHLVSLGPPKVDGRNRDARMIPASLTFKGGPHSWQMRAEKHDGKWKVRF